VVVKGEVKLRYLCVVGGKGQLVCLRDSGHGEEGERESG